MKRLSTVAVAAMVDSDRRHNDKIVQDLCKVYTVHQLARWYTNKSVQGGLH